MVGWILTLRQNGHSPDYTNRYSKTLEDYNRTPIKPVLDAEPLYEDIPLNFDADPPRAFRRCRCKKSFILGSF